jgi:hypothetical protein
LKDQLVARVQEAFNGKGNHNNQNNPEQKRKEEES